MEKATVTQRGKNPRTNWGNARESDMNCKVGVNIGFVSPGER